MRASTMDELARVASEQGVASWLQIERETLLPPVLETVYMSDLGLEINNPVATRPYERKTGDTNLVSHPELFDQLSRHLDWEAACGQGLTWREEDPREP